MFEQPVAGRSPEAMPRWTWSGATAAVLHALLAAGALWGTSHKAEARISTWRGEGPPVMLPWPKRDEGAAPSPSTPITPPVLTGLRDLPTDLPVMGLSGILTPRFDGVLGLARSTLAADDGGGPGAAPDELPELLAAPPPAYPEALRQARITGSVTVEAVVDTSGRAEPASIRVVASAHAGFEPAAREAVRRALFRPARVQGRAVRALVRVPVEFRLST